MLVIRISYKIKDIFQYLYGNKHHRLLRNQIYLKVECHLNDFVYIDFIIGTIHYIDNG